MTGNAPKRGFATRPADPDRWVRAPQPSSDRTSGTNLTARLTVDVTRDLRGRIKIAAFQRGLTVADMLRALLEREFPADGVAAP